MYGSRRQASKYTTISFLSTSVTIFDIEWPKIIYRGVFEWITRFNRNDGRLAIFCSNAFPRHLRQVTQLFPTDFDKHFNPIIQNLFWTSAIRDVRGVECLDMFAQQSFKQLGNL